MEKITVDKLESKQLMHEFGSIIEHRLRELTEDLEPAILYEPMRYFLAEGGKRIRPILTLAACGAINEKPLESLDAAIAVEILHNFTLIHDDIMDRSDFRRGRPTVHKRWGEPTAILVGDVMVGHCLKILPGPRKHPRCHEILTAFTSGLIEVCEGQGLDMLFNEDQSVTLSQYIEMITKKTSKMLETAVMMGGITANGNEEQLGALRDYAINFGLGFQIQDDLLDLTADVNELGKMIGKDIIEGKKTYLIILAKKMVKNPEDKALLEKFYEENGLSEEYIPAMREIMKNNGVLEIAGNTASEYFDKAAESLKLLPENKYKNLLNEILNNLRNRRK